MKKSTRFFSFLILGLMLTASVHSHELWINMTNYKTKLWQHPQYAPTPRAKTIAYFGWGHTYPVGDFLKKDYLDTITQIEPDGSRLEVKVGDSGFRAVEITMNTDGPRIFAAEVEPGFHADMYYEMFAKALVGVGEIKGNPYSKPVGQGVEIIPSKNPNELKPGDTLSIKVLEGGKPAKDYEIKAIPMFSGTGEVEKVTTGKSGKAVINIKPYYGPWIITASTMVPAEGELAKKCKNHYKLATLTFAVSK